MPGFDLGMVKNMLMSEYSNDSPAKDYVSGASEQINNLTRKRVKDLLAKYSATNMSRSGISGVAENDIFSEAGKSLSDVAAQGEIMDANNKKALLGEMGGIAQYEDSKPTFMDYVGSLLGSLGGKALGMGESAGLNKLFGSGGASAAGV